MKDIKSVESGRIEITHVLPHLRRDVILALDKAGIDVPRSWLYDDKIWELCNEDGKFAKRFAKLVKRVTGKKLSNGLMGFIGDAATVLRPGRIYTYDFTTVFDWDAGDFGDTGSCFWGQYSDCRKMLEDNDYHALRIYKDDEGFARAWVKALDGYYIVFNGYGLPTESMAWLLQVIVDAEICKSVDLWSTEGVIYINHDTGYYVSDTPPSSNYLEIPIEIAVCTRCGCRTENWIVYDEYIYCRRCRDEHFAKCAECKEWHERDYLVEVDLGSECINVCYDCVGTFWRCEFCNNWFGFDYLVEVDLGSECINVCYDCVGTFWRCEFCNNWFGVDAMVELQYGGWACKYCAEEEE